MSDVVAETRIPKAGEAWRHYKGNLYEIVGTGYDEATGCSVVVYKPYRWSFNDEPALWVRRLDVFLGMTETKKRRFTFERASASCKKHTWRPWGKTNDGQTIFACECCKKIL